MSDGHATGASEIREFFARKAARVARERRELLLQAQLDAGVIVEFIIKTYNPSRIFQWGSLVHTQRFTERSDIDVAIEGLAHPLDLHRIIDYAESVTQFPVDIVPIEEIDPVYADSIRANGKIVYERK